MFERKKLKIETLGEYLAEVRGAQGLEAKEVTKRTGISLKFLKALEAGNFKELPPDVYVFGFLKQLSRVYNLEREVLTRQYSKEKSISKNIDSQNLEPISGIKKVFKGLVVTPKSLSIFVGVLFVVMSIGYIFWQVLSINKAPDLEIFEPQNNTLVAGSLVEIKGATQPGATVQVNQQEVFVESDGKFSTQLGLNPGSKELIIVASNKFGKSTSKRLNIIGQAEASVKKLVLELSASEAVEVGYSADGGKEQKLKIKEGETLNLEAAEKIILSADNAGAVSVRINGELVGKLGSEGESVQGVSFSAESGTIN